MAALKDGYPHSGSGSISTSCLRSHTGPFAFITALPQPSDPKIRTKFYLILRKLHRIRKIFLKIMLHPCK